MKRLSRATLLVTSSLLASAVCAGTATPAAVQAAAGTRYLDMVFSSATLVSNVVYANAPALQTGTPTDLLLDIYRPAGDVLTSRPALVTIHGGGFKGGTKAALADVSEEWARRGYVVLDIDYRLDSGNKCQELQDGQIPPDQVPAETARCQAAMQAAKFDASAAIRWTRAHAAAYGIDPTRIAALGGSAGAVTVVNLAYGSDVPGDIGDYDGYDSRIGAGLAMSGCSYDPTTIGAGDAPVSFIHAELDAAVPFQCAVATAALARARGLAAETLLWYGEATHAQALYKKYQSTIDPSWTAFLYRELNLHQRLEAGSMTEIHGTPNTSAVVSVVATETYGRGYLELLPCDAQPGDTSNLNSDGQGQTRAGLGVVRFDATGTACVFNSMSTHVVVDLQGYLAADSFEDVADDRVLDTRNGSRVAAGTMTVLHGAPGRSAMLSLVATSPLTGGWVQVLPCGAQPGSTSNLNVDAAGQSRAAAAIVAFDAAGTACIYTTATTHLVADLQGYFAPDAFEDTVDERLADTRQGAAVAAGSTTVIHGPANTSGFVSLVATRNSGSGWLQVLPCGDTAGSTSNLNTDRAGITIAGAAVARFDADGEACVYSSASTHLVVDLQGTFAPGAFDDVDDVRLLDTRPAQS